MNFYFLCKDTTKFCTMQEKSEKNRLSSEKQQPKMRKLVIMK